MITLIEIRKRLSETIRQSEMTQEQLAQQLHINQSANFLLYTREEAARPLIRLQTCVKF